VFFGPIELCPLEPAPCDRVAEWGALPRFSADGTRIEYYAWGGPGVVHVRSVRPDGTDDRDVARLEGTHPIGSFFSVARDGRVAYVEFEPGRGELWMADLDPPPAPR